MELIQYGVSMVAQSGETVIKWIVISSALDDWWGIIKNDSLLHVHFGRTRED